MLQDLIDLDAAAREQTLAELAQLHPERADVLRRRLQLLDDQLPAAAMADPPPVRTFGRFQLLQEIGRGMTEVHEALDTTSGERVVLKLLRHAHLLDRATAGSFAREALAASRLQHPCIGTVLESGVLDGVQYLVRPFVPGITLAQWIRERRDRGHDLAAADVDLVLGWMEEVLQALHCAHQAGLVHRDVKPSNILLPYQGRPRLLDFGLCREPGTPDPANTPTPAVGTIAYMAPEALAAPGNNAGFAADVYAAGITLFEALALRPPFDAANPQAMSRAILLQATPDPGRQLAHRVPGLRRVLAAALAKDPKLRYPSALAFADDLRRLRGGAAVAAPRRPFVRHLDVLARPRTWLALLPAAVVAAGIWLTLPGTAAGAADPDFEWIVLADQVRSASAAAAALTPGTPEQVAALQQWLHEHGEPLDAALPRLRRRLATLDRGPGVDAVTSATMRCGLAALEAFVAAPEGALPVVRRRLAWARQAAHATLERPATSWQETIAAIAADPRYGGLRLQPQVDLVPLGRDRSGLFEFYHPRSAWPGTQEVTRDARGALARHDMMGIVFVLIPGGEFTAGEQPFHATAPRYDPDASIYSRPHPVTLQPFFLAKYEMTRAQWEQLFGTTRGALPIGSVSGGDPAIGYGHPVDSVSAREADAALQSVGLLLPTEAQWEWACGTGASTLWFFGDDVRTLVRYANVLDRRYRAANTTRGSGLDLDDGFAGPAPVGRFAPNPFGLHDILGNVAEWCRDDLVDFTMHLPGPGDGMRSERRPDGLRAARGGSFLQESVRTSSRLGTFDTTRDRGTGVRPARAITGVPR